MGQLATRDGRADEIVHTEDLCIWDITLSTWVKFWSLSSNSEHSWNYMGIFLQNTLYIEINLGFEVDLLKAILCGLHFVSDYKILGVCFIHRISLQLLRAARSKLNTNG